MKVVQLDIEGAVSRLGDKALYLEVAHAFASHIPDSLGALYNALNNNDFTAATRLAHSLKSNCATVGAESLRLVCGELEKSARTENLDHSLALLERARSSFVELQKQLLSLT